MTQLVLIEGPVGAGKSTIAEWVARHLRARGRDVEQPHGFDPAHPIRTLCEQRARTHSRGEDLGELVHDEHDEEVYTAPQWTRMVDALCDGDRVLVAEGKYFQQCLEYPRHLGASDQAVLREQSRIIEAIRPAAPVLIYLGSSDVAAQIRRVASQRPESWLEWLGGFFALHPWSRGRGSESVFEFYEAWSSFEAHLVREHPAPKLELLDSHEDWDAARDRIAAFLEGGDAAV